MRARNTFGIVPGSCLDTVAFGRGVSGGDVESVNGAGGEGNPYFEIHCRNVVPQRDVCTGAVDCDVSFVAIGSGVETVSHIVAWILHFVLRGKNGAERTPANKECVTGAAADAGNELLRGRHGNHRRA